ncbi:MAG: RNA polymerase sigma factor [Bacteroidota bacterium]|nr:RNA polymerase sigma factor [Bacteroidota bacterium]MDP4231831.1 RNA polymerase sigma factor [Bacteroidota bacterium]MDP4242717.1 RNA polymerase sigma factor [Bacteroidota bacterium]MDP4287168.1 RNA polymerase sigma factor [Bacteroidota bacterium]
MQVEQQFWALIEKYWESLWRFSLGLTCSKDDAADLLSDTVLEAHKGYPTLRSPQAFKSYLFTIAHRLHKRRSWRLRIFAQLEEAMHIGYENSRESSFDLDLLLVALGALPEKQREAILLFEISGLSLEEIRAIQGGSLSAIKTRLSRGREALRETLLDRTDLRESLSTEQISFPKLPEPGFQS